MFSMEVVPCFDHTSVVVAYENRFDLRCFGGAAIRFMKFCLFQTMVSEFLFHSVDGGLCLLAGS